MQDRFKFRYNYNNKIYDVSVIDFTCSRGEIVSLDKMETLMCKLDLDNLIQCTGLKDKNEKLIYEGDIVKTTLADNSKIIFLVVWNDKNATFDGKIIKKELTNGSLLFVIKQDYLYYLLGNGNDEKTEIIGNKFQNPELLSEVE